MSGWSPLTAGARAGEQVGGPQGGHGHSQSSHEVAGLGLPSKMTSLGGAGVKPDCKAFEDWGGGTFPILPVPTGLPSSLPGA